MHQEIVCLRQILKAANRHGWLEYIPNLSSPTKAGKFNRRAWFNPEEYKQLYTATRERALKPINPHRRKECEDLHDFVLFMVNTGLRPDEANRLQFRDVQIVKEKGAKDPILHIDVRGKRGTGYCKSMPGAVYPFERIMQRRTPKPDPKNPDAPPPNRLNHDRPRVSPAHIMCCSTQCSMSRTSRSTARTRPEPPTACAIPTSACA